MISLKISFLLKSLILMQCFISSVYVLFCYKSSGMGGGIGNKRFLSAAFYKINRRPDLRTHAPGREFAGIVVGLQIFYAYFIYGPLAGFIEIKIYFGDVGHYEKRFGFDGFRQKGGGQVFVYDRFHADRFFALF